MESIIEMAFETGIWAALFVVLFFYQIKDSKTREEKYQETIAKLATSLEIVAEIDQKVSSIKKCLDNTAEQSEKVE